MIYTILTNNNSLIRNFLKTFSYHKNKYENLIIVIDNKSAKFEELESTILSFSDKIKIIKLTDIEDYSIQTLSLKNYKIFTSVCPIQAKLLIPFYFKWKLGIDKFLMMDDDILVNCNIETLNLDKIEAGGTHDKFGPGHIAPYMLHQFNLCNALLGDKFKKPNTIQDITRIVVCAFIITVYDDYAEYIFRFFNEPIIYNYIKETSRDFTIVHGLKRDLYPFEEVALNLYIESHAKNFYLFEDKLVFHYWGNQTGYHLYKDPSYLKNCLFIHGHLRDKYGSKVPYGNWIISNFMSYNLDTGLSERYMPEGYVKKSDCPIVYCFDRTYLPFAQKSIRSVLAHNKNAEIILCVPEYFEEFKEFRQIFVNDILNQISTFITTQEYCTYISKTAYTRLLLPTILLEYDKILYLDADILCYGNLNKLLETDIQFIGAVPDINEKLLVARLNRNRLDYINYINSGVLLMNLKNLRFVDFTKKCIEFPVYAYPKNVNFYHDQAIINDLLRYSMAILPPIYNYQLSPAKTYTLEEYKKLTKTNKLIHFLATANNELFFKAKIK